MKKAKQKLVNHFHQILSLELNTFGIGFADKAYMEFTPLLKTMPFRIIVPVSIVITFVTYIIFRAKIILLTSLLQYGF